MFPVFIDELAFPCLFIFNFRFMYVCRAKIVGENKNNYADNLQLLFYFASVAHILTEQGTCQNTKVN